VRSNDHSDPGKDQIIIFSRINTNLGNLNNGHTGVFYCDVPRKKKLFHSHSPVNLAIQYEGCSKSLTNRYTENTQSIGI